jgi:hypothetical protein
MSNQLQVHEFCRAFDNVNFSEEYNRWVSGGYSPRKIDNYDVKVPNVIEQAVRDGYFSINDNFPPGEEDFAVIAREISTGKDDGKVYSVLVIMNRQIDDAGRPTVGYRYFWTDAHDFFMDGIVQLLFFWLKNGKLKFNMKELNPSYQKDRTLPQLGFIDVRSKEETIDFAISLLDNSSINFFESSINHIIDSFDRKEQYDSSERIDLLIIHSVTNTILLGVEDTTLLCSWSFNVLPTHLFYPKSFICMSNNNSVECNKELLGMKGTIPTSDNKNIGLTINQVIPPHKERKIKQLLSDIEKNYRVSKGENVDFVVPVEFFDYLIEYENTSWSGCIDQVRISQHSESYNALVYLINRSDVDRKKWLVHFWDNIKPFSLLDNIIKKILRKKPVLTTALDFHDALIGINVDNENANKILKDSIFFGISWILKHRFLYSAKRIDQANFKYLFVTSDTIWSEVFKEFLSQVIEELNSPHNSECLNISKHVKLFCQGIEKTIASKETSDNYLSRRSKILAIYGKLDSFCENISLAKLSATIEKKYPPVQRNISSSSYLLVPIQGQKRKKPNSNYLRILIILIVLPLIFMAIRSLFLNGREMSDDTQNKKGDCIKTLKIMKECYSSKAEFTMKDIELQLLANYDPPFGRPVSYLDSIKYLKSSADEADYKKRKSKINTCVIYKAPFLFKCLNEQENG